MQPPTPQPNQPPVANSSPPLLHALGLDHHRLTFPHEGRPASLTDPEVTPARVVRELLG